MVEPWISVLVRMRMGGDPARPSSSTFQSQTGEECVTCGEKAGDVGHLAAGDEGEAGGRWNVEQIFEPGAHNLFDYGGGGRGGVHSGVLIPGGGEPVGGQGGGERAADYPAEETRAGGVDDAALDCFYEVVDDSGGVSAGVFEGEGEVFSQGGEVGGCGYEGEEAGVR